MQTDNLIHTLAADAGRSSVSPDRVWWAVLGLAALLAGAACLLTLGPRPDIAAAAATIRFPFKFVVTLTLAVTAFALIRHLARPGAAARSAGRLVLLAPALLAAAVVIELLAVPYQAWGERLVGTNSMVCLVFIPLLGALPLAVFVLALRHGAPTRPAVAGAVAGLLAGGVAATFYAAHCTDDSPLFVATWYTIAILGLAAAGAVAARLFVRW
ncbi:MAG TPA: NrsF family protein [Arenibaculum sp.]|nr:NrsF family protein [Arenibaculum sp.]